MISTADRAAFQAIRTRLADRRWRLDTLYAVTDREGRQVPFRMNGAQDELYRGMGHFNVVLKARQLGISTFVLLFLLDACLFNSNVRAGVIARTRDDALALFGEKVRYAYDRLPGWLKAARPPVVDRADELAFPNNSSLRVGTSMRGGTLQYLHVSEYGKISARHPEKAREIRSGAFNAVAAGQILFVESTAEGQEGEFYELCRRARALADQGRAPTPLDPTFHFFPWWREPAYRLDPAGVVVTPEDEAYFARIEAASATRIGPAQRAWYVKKAEGQGSDMKREYPSTPDEAFEASIEGAYFANEMAAVRRQGRIARVPHAPTVPVNTFWDLGMDDATAIWLHQRVGHENRFIGYYAGSGEGLAHYADWLRRTGYVFGEHYLPHDVEVMELGTGASRRATLEGLGVRPVMVVPRPRHLADGIQAVRNALASCWFDEAACAAGIRSLDRYRKEWDDRLGVWKDRPRHDESSHGADAFRQFATGYREPAPAMSLGSILGRGRGSGNGPGGSPGGGWMGR